MSLPVLTAVTGAVWESELVGALASTAHGLTVVRRCVDLADLLAVAGTGSARAVLLSADLHRLDREAVARLLSARVAVIGVVDRDDAGAAQRLQQVGVRTVLPADAGPEAVAAAVHAAVAELAATVTPAREIADPGAALPPAPLPVGQPDPDPPPGPGRVVAVWGPTGAPGRSTVALALADEAARLGVPALLVDADVYGGALGQALGLLEESPGLAAATRQAAQGTLDLAGLATLAWAVTPTFRLLTGITRPDRWPELRPGAVEVVLDLARQLAPFVVIDCAFCLEQDEEVSYDAVSPRRNGATLAAVSSADTLLAVSGADPVGLQRVVRALGEVRDAVPTVTPRVVVNRVRGSVVPGDPRREIAAALSRFAGVTDPVFLPDDPTATDAALAAGRTLADVAPRSKLRLALRELAAELSGAQVPVTAGRWSRRSTRAPHRGPDRPQGGRYSGRHGR